MACVTAEVIRSLMLREALEELREIKEMGFNLVRVHATATRPVGRIQGSDSMLPLGHAGHLLPPMR